MTESQKDVTGLVRVKLYKGNIIAPAARVRRASTIRTSPRWKPTTTYNQDDATGFIRLNALRLKVRALRKDV